MSHKVVIIGGGFSGLAAAFTLSRGNIPVVLLEKESFLGGVATSTTLRDGRKVPICYHHILSTDKSLLKFLDDLNLSTRIRWEKISIVSNIDGKTVNLGSPLDILRLERLPFFSRFRYCLFGARCLLKKNWKDWEGESVEKLISTWTDNFILKEIFRPLVDIKFGLSAKEIDAAWLGERLHKREAATHFGYIPNTSWTYECCESFKKEIEKKGGKIFLKDEPQKLITTGGKITHVITQGGRLIKTSAVLNTAPPPTIVPLLKKSGFSPKLLASLGKIKYISSYSLIAALPLEIFPDYWTIALHPRKIFGACFNLSALNKTLSNEKDASIINLFTNVPFNKFEYSQNEYLEKTKRDLSELIGKKVKFNWVILNRLKYSSPIFDINYSNPPTRIAGNLYSAGIYCAFPKIASTGQAIQTGKDAALKIISDIKY